MNGHLTYTPTEKQLVTAYKLHWPKGLNWKLLLFVAVLSLAVALTLARPGATRVQDIAMIATGGMVGGSVTAVIIQWVTAKLWVPRFARRIYRQQADLKLETRIEWSEQGFRAINSAGEGMDHWSRFFQWKCGPDMLLLYRSEALFNFVPLDIPGGAVAGQEIVHHLQVAGVKMRHP